MGESIVWFCGCLMATLGVAVVALIVLKLLGI